MEDGTGAPGVGLLAGELKGLREVKLLDPIEELGEPGTPEIQVILSMTLQNVSKLKFVLKDGLST